MGLEIPKLNEFERRLLKLAKEKFPKETKKELRKLAAQTLRIARKKTKSLTKKKTGNLLKGWKIGKFYQRGHEYWVLVKNIAPHAPLVEAGHKVQQKKDGPVLGEAKGRHLLEDSIKEMTAKAPEELRKWLEKMIREAGL